MYTRM